jgi:hypothetical protein
MEPSEQTQNANPSHEIQPPPVPSRKIGEDIIEPIGNPVDRNASGDAWRAANPGSAIVGVDIASKYENDIRALTGKCGLPLDEMFPEALGLAAWAVNKTEEGCTIESIDTPEGRVIAAVRPNGDYTVARMRSLTNAAQFAA